ncbi:MAG: hypothetical protein HY591_01395, partial [Candidatus Omnitrophica bacterium]|nr:hypothetical protein [Candidatus Omnitrophota bacterium]
ALGTQIIREVILPELEKEVNTGKNFANLRQVFNSIILASWYKKNLKQALLNQVYADKNKIDGIKFRRDAIHGVFTPEEIYQRYLAAYKKGVFNYIKEDTIEEKGQREKGKTIPRKYFSGGMRITPDHVAVNHDAAALAAMSFTATDNRLAAVRAGMSLHDAAMTAEQLYSALRQIARENELEESQTPADLVAIYRDVLRIEPDAKKDELFQNNPFLGEIGESLRQYLSAGDGDQGLDRIIGQLKAIDQAELVDDQPVDKGIDNAQTITPTGGIDLDTADMKWNSAKDGKGVEIKVDQAMIDNIRHNGIERLTPVIYRVTPIASV